MKVGKARLAGYARLSAVVVAALYGTAGAQARDLIWDPLQSTTGPTDGNGTWDNLATPNWYDPGASALTTFNSSIPDSALFGAGNTSSTGTGGGDLVTLGSSISVQNITLGTTTTGGYYNITDDGNSDQTLTLFGNVTKTAAVGALTIGLSNAIVLTTGNHVFALNDTSGDTAELTVSLGFTGNGGLTLDNGSQSYNSFGTLLLTSDSSYTGGTNISNGRLVIDTSGALGGAAGGTVTIANAGTLSIGGVGSKASGLNVTTPINVTRNTYSGGNFGNYPDAIITTNGSGTNTFSGPFTVSSTDARVSAQSSTIVISSNIASGIAGSQLTLDGDLAGFVNLTGDNRALSGGIALIGSVELTAGTENSLAGATSALNLSGGTIHPTGDLLTDGFLNDFGTHVINNGTGPTALGTLNTGVDVDPGVTFNASSLYGVSLGSRGTGTLNFNGTNVLSGNPFFDAGNVNVNGNSSFGSIQLRNSTFNVASGATLNSSNGGIINTVGFDGTNSGTLNLLAGSTSTFAGPLHLGGAAGTHGTLTVANTSSLTINYGGGGALDFGDTSTGSGTFNGGTVNVAGETWIGNGSGGVGVVQYNAGSLTVNNWFVVGRSGANGTLNQSGGTITKQGDSGTAAIINDSGATSLGTYNLSGTGVFNETAGQFWVGQGGGVGVLNVSDAGSLTINDWLAVGRAGGTGTVNLTSGTITQQTNGHLTIGSGGTGTVNVNGGTLTGLNPYIGEAGSGSGTLNVNNGGTVVLNGTTTFGNADSVTGTLNLNGGTVTAAQFVHGASTGTQTFNFAGGTVVASASNANYLSGLNAANVLAGGATFNSSGFNISVGQNLIGSTTSPGGGLAKLGAGTLTLAGSNSYTGATNVSGGTLASANPGALPTGTVLNVTNGANVNFNGQYVQPAISTTPGLTLASLTATGGNTFGFNLSTASAIDYIGFTAPSAVTGSNTINLSFGGGTNVSTGTYNLFADTAGGLGNNTFSLLLNGTTGNTIAANGKVYTLALSSTDMLDQLTIAQAAAAGKLYYTGQSGTDFNTFGNYSTDATGTPPSNTAPSSLTDVVFTATGNVANTTPMVNGAAAANSLEFNNASGVTIGGTGTITLAAGLNTFNAGTGIVVDAGAGASTINANLSLPTSEQFVNNSANPLTLNGSIGATGTGTTLTYAGNGSGGAFVVGGANTYAGATNVSAGAAVQLSSGSALGAAGNTLNLLSGSVDLNGQQVTQSSLNLAGGRLIGSLGTGTLNLTSTGATLAITGNYPQPRAVGDITAALSLPSGGAIVKPTVNGQPVFTGNVTLNGPAVVALIDTGGDAAAELTLTGVVSGGPTASLTLNNAALFPGVKTAVGDDFGTLLLTGSNTYGGGTNIASGKIVITNSAALGTTGPVTIVQRAGGGGGVLAFGDSNYTATTSPLAVGIIATGITVPNAINFGGQVTGTYGYGIYNDSGDNTLSGLITLTNATQNIYANNGSLTVSNVIGESFTGAGLVKQGPATLNLTGTANTYTGPTQITNGLLVVNALANGSSPSSIGASTAAPANLLLSGGTLQYNGSSVVTNRGYTLTAGTTFNTGSANVTFGGQILSTGGSFTKIGAGTLTYTNATGTNTFAASGGYPGFLVNQGIVNIGTPGATASGQVNTFNGEVDSGGTSELAATELDFNSGTNNINNYLAAARGSSTTGLVSTINLNTDTVVNVQNFGSGYDNGLANYNAAVVANLNGTSTLNDTGVFRLAENAGSTVAVNVNPGTTLNVSSGNNGQLQVGYRGVGTLNQLGGTVTTTGVQMGFDNNTTGSGTYNLSGRHPADHQRLQQRRRDHDVQLQRRHPTGHRQQHELRDRPDRRQRVGTGCRGRHPGVQRQHRPSHCWPRPPAPAAG